MKKATKILALTLTALTFAVSAATVSGCKIRDNESNTDDKLYYDTATVYAQAQDLGYKGTLDEFIEMISGKDGTDGKNGKDGTDGKDGAGVKSGRIDERGHLILTLTDDSEIDCGEIVPPAHEHTFGDWFIIKESGCTTAGLKLHTCECGHTESQTISAKGHGDLKWETTNTTHTHICSICKAEIDSGEHVFVDGVCECGVTEPIVMTNPVEYTEILREFGYLPNSSLGGSWRWHFGIDFGAPVGTDVVAAFEGTVESIVVGDNIEATAITIAHRNNLKTVYQFIDIREGLQVGDKVTRGEVIATVAEASGDEFKLGSHLHFEILNNGENVDPNDYLNNAELPKPADPDTPTDDDSTTFSAPLEELNIIKSFNNNPGTSLDDTSTFHVGVDLESSVGTEVYACLSGTVESVTTDSLGNTTLTLVHENQIATIYTYVSVKAGLKSGDRVSRGEVIATVAEILGSENQQSAHLHFGVKKNGQLVDPVEYLGLSEK